MSMRTRPALLNETFVDNNDKLYCVIIVQMSAPNDCLVLPVKDIMITFQENLF